MPVKGTCLLFDTPLKEALFDVVEFMAYDRLSKGKGASLAAIFSELRNAGVEVDLPTVGEIYNNVLPRDDANFDSEMEIDDYVGRTYAESIDRLAHLEKLVGEQTIDEMSPETAVANFIVKALSSSLQVDERTKSDMKKLQDALRTGVQRHLGKLGKKVRPEMTSEEIISEALGWDQIGITDLSGRLNSMSDLFTAMKAELSKASDAVSKSDPAIIEKYDQYVKDLENKAYTVLFRTKDALQVRNDAMKAAGFGKKLSNGKTILDWNKMAGEIGSVSDIRTIVEKVFADAGYSPDVVERLKDSLQDEFVDLRAEIIDKSKKELERREKSSDRPYQAQKTDLKRLIELYHLNVFDGTHDQLLYDTIGVNDLQQEDLYDIQQLTKVAADLSRMVARPTDQGGYGLFNDVFASREFQRIQRHIDSIINRNRNNRTVLLKVLSWIKNYLDVMLSGLLSMPTTLAQNILSGAQAVWTGTRLAYSEGWTDRTKQAFGIYGAMLKHVGSTGQAYGEEIGSFATQELFTNSLKWNWTDGSFTDKAKSVLYAATTPIRIGLLAFDSANKAALTNKVFYNAIFNSLISDKGYSRKDASDFMNVMLYGQSFEDAKKMAKDIIDKNNAMLDPKFRSKASDAEITTLANDIVKANLNNNEAIRNEVLEAALKSSYHVAGLGLGHEPNNPLSKGIKSIRDWSKRRQDQLASDKQWDKLAAQRFIDLFVNGFMIRFAGGATNWLVLRLKGGLGLGLLTGGLKMAFGSEKIRWDSPSNLREDIKNREDARNDIARALVGAANTAVAYLIGYLLTGGDGDEEDKKRLASLKEKKNKTDKDREEILRLENLTSVYVAIKNNVANKRAFKATAPDLMLIDYYTENSNDKKLISGLLSYASNTYAGDDKFSWAGKMVTAGVMLKRGNRDEAMGVLSSIAGDQFAVPLWRSYREYYRLTTNTYKLATGQPTTPAAGYVPPTDWMSGLFGGGALEELGAYKRDAKIIALQGVGPSSFERFKKKGISNMSDLKGEWWKMKDGDGRILNAENAFEAKKHYEKIKKEQ